MALVTGALWMSASAWGAPVAMPAVEAPPAAVAAEAPAEELTPGQFEAASRVLTGLISCEFGQIIQITPVDGKPGHFEMVFGKTTYILVPHETSTGAVRLEDRKAGVVWLQIPAKSLLLNSKLGQRMVDSCLHSEQRSAAPPANSSLGIADAPLAPAEISAPQGPASEAPALSR